MPVLHLLLAGVELVPQLIHIAVEFARLPDRHKRVSA